MNLKSLGSIKRNPYSHKGDNGRVLIIGGSKDYVGCLCLAGSACLAAGIDVVTIAAPKKVAWAINTLNPDFITRKLQGDYLGSRSFKFLRELSESFDVLLVGNGMGLRPGTKVLVNRLAAIGKPKVLDADALKLLELDSIENSILTPHIKELEILLRNNAMRMPSYDEKTQRKVFSGKIQSLLAGVLARNNVLLIKGRTDIIISANKIAYNTTGNSGMSKAGTGDVLAGLAAAFLCIEDQFKAACRAAFVNGLAGDLLYRSKGYGFTASELIGSIPIIMKRFWKAGK